jgi:dolichyl-phosphate-mannose-protein mannosyltransferase
MKRSAVITLGGILIVVAVLCASSARIDTVTVDEPAHIAGGMIGLQFGWLGVYHGQAPLMNAISAIPLLAAGYRMPEGWQVGADEWAAGRSLLYHNGVSTQRVLFLARLPTIVLFLALGVAVFAFVRRQTGSDWWAVGAAALTGFCPNLMAHGRLVTVDAGVTFFAFAAAAALICLVDKPAVIMAMLVGLSLSAAVLSKVSALILGPYFVVVIAGAFAFRRVREPLRFLSMLAIAALTSLVFFEGFVLLEMSHGYIAGTYPATPRLLIPFRYYAGIVAYIRTFYSQANYLLQFRLGNASTSGWRDYFLVAFLLKTTLPAMLLLIAAIVAGARRKRFDVFALLAFIVMFMATASGGHVDLGIRYVLPIYPFIYALIAIAFAGEQQRIVVVALAALILWHVGENLARYPSYIAYFNELIGSQRNADKFLIDSNLDWGQDLRRLDQWCRKHGIREISVHYFGGADMRYEKLSTNVHIVVRPPLTPLTTEYFAVSRHLYRLSRWIWNVDYDRCLERQHAEYVTTIGGSMNVYRRRAAVPAAGFERPARTRSVAVGQDARRLRTGRPLSAYPCAMISASSPIPRMTSSIESPPRRRANAERQMRTSSGVVMRTSATPLRSMMNVAGSVRPMRRALTPADFARRRTSSP